MLSLLLALTTFGNPCTKEITDWRKTRKPTSTWSRAYPNGSHQTTLIYNISGDNLVVAFRWGESVPGPQACKVFWHRTDGSTGESTGGRYVVDDASAEAKLEALQAD
jgi:hypothetical protein